VRRDDLTPRERFAALARGESADRLPCIPIYGNGAARLVGAKVSAFRGNGRLIADAQTAAYRRFGYDGVRVFTDLYTQAEAMGARVRYPDDETAFLEAPAIGDVREIGTLAPADPLRDGNLPHQLEAMRRTVDAIGAEVPVTGALTGPFTTASFLVGAETLARLMLKEPEAVHRLCGLSLETAMAYANAIFDTGAVPSLTCAMSSCTVISPRQFRAFSFPYLVPLVDLIHARGAAVTLHVCGKTAGIWEDMASAGVDTISIDNDADLSAAKRLVGDRVGLMGNVKPSEVMLLGTPGDVRRAVRECVANAYDNPKGYIVASGCSLPTETSFENVDAMMDAVREIGWPVSPGITP
jgi:uroporphyrinogen decarboxylase